MAGLAHTGNGFPGGLLKCFSPGSTEETLSREQSEGDNFALTMGLMHRGIIPHGTELLLSKVTTICLCGIGDRWAEICCTQTPEGLHSV